MRSLWLCWQSANAEVEDPFAAVDYPLCFNLPSQSWRLEADAVPLLRQSVAPRLNVDLLFELARDLTPTGPVPDAGWIRGLRLCVGISEGAFAAQAARDLVLTQRDQGVCRYYARWPQAYNTVTAPLPQADPAALPPLQLTVGGDTRRIKARPRFEPLEVLRFFHSFNSLAAGDLVSLGFLAQDLELPAARCEASLSLGPDWACTVTISPGAA